MILEMELNGMVLEKFRDSTNHNYNTLIINDLQTNKNFKLYIINESGGFYKSVNIGDTIIKNTSSLIIKDITQGWTDTLNYNCKE